MSIILEMPALSPSMESGNLIDWKKKEGDKVSVGDIIAEIETDKAIMEWESIYDGTLAKIIVDSGTNDVPVKTAIAVLRENGDSDSDVDAAIAKASSGCGVQDVSSEAHGTQTEQTTCNGCVDNKEAGQVCGTSANTDTENCGRIFATPLARNIARNNNVDLACLSGTGINGRIVKDDVLAYINSGSYNATSHESHVFAKNIAGPVYEDLVPTGMRKAIAANLCQSKQTIPHFYLATQAVVDGMLDFRDKANSMSITNNKLLIDAFIMKYVADAMLAVPEVNVSWVGDKLRKFNTVNIAIAISLDGGLVTPVISNVQLKSVAELSDEIHHVVGIVRSGKTSKDHMAPCSITLSNLGMYQGIDNFYSIVPMNNGSILSIAAAKKTPVVTDDGGLDIKTVMKFGYAGDHRCIDGAVAARFLDEFVKRFG